MGVVRRMLPLFVYQALTWASPRGCDCVYDNDLREVFCEPGTQFSLPWSLPDCLNNIQYDEIERLVLSEQEFPTLPASSFSMFTNLRYIDLSFSNIDTVEEFAFDENRKLETILISSNNINSLPNLFNDNDNSLKSVTANHNRLSMLYSEHLSGMLFLSLNYNEFTEAGVQQSVVNMPNLIHLSLEKN